MDIKWSKGKLFYWVEWKSFGTEERSWEPVENINTHTCIHKFHLLCEHKKKVCKWRSTVTLTCRCDCSGAASSAHVLTPGPLKCQCAPQFFLFSQCPINPGYLQIHLPWLLAWAKKFLGICNSAKVFYSAVYWLLNWLATWPCLSVCGLSWPSDCLLY